MNRINEIHWFSYMISNKIAAGWLKSAAILFFSTKKVIS